MNARRVVLAGLALLGDGLAVAAAHTAAFFLRFHTGLFSSVVPSVPRYLALGLLATGVFCLAMGCAGGYRFPRRADPWRVLVLVFRGLAIWVPAVILAVYLLRLGTYRAEEPFLYSRVFLASSWVATSALVAAWRCLLGTAVVAATRRGILVRPAAVVGDPHRARTLRRALEQNPWVGDVVVAEWEPHALPDPIPGADPAPERIRVIWLACDGEDVVRVLAAVARWSRGVACAMPQSAYSRWLEWLATQRAAQTLDGDETMALAARVEHGVDPTERPAVAFVGSRGIPATYGGVERTVEEVSVRLAAAGFRASVYTRPHYSPARGTYRGVSLRPIPCVRTKHLETITHTVLSTLHCLFFEDDVVHFQALGPSLLVWLPRLVGRKTVVTVQGLDWQRKKWGPIARWALRAGEWCSARLPHRTVVVSHDLLRRYEAQGARRVVHIPNGVNEAVPRPPHAIRQWGLGPGSYVLSVGRLVPEKRHDLILEAFQTVRTDKRLVIAGGESHTQAHVDKLRALTRDPRVLFVGYAYGDLLQELFSNAYLFVSASEVEGFPLAVLEAMSHGLCVLASDIPPHLEALGDPSLLFRTGDAPDLASRLQHLVDHPELVREAGAMLQARAREHYGWDPIAAAYGALYEDLCGRTRWRP